MTSLLFQQRPVAAPADALLAAEFGWASGEGSLASNRAIAEKRGVDCDVAH
jgi:hypothetical protein